MSMIAYQVPTLAIEVHHQLTKLFERGKFLLRKWNSSDATVLQQIPQELRDSHSMCVIQAANNYTKTLGIEWNPSHDHFRLTIADLPPIHNLTKRMLVSDIAKTFDVLGWFSPTIIKMKILLQRLWEMNGTTLFPRRFVTHGCSGDQNCICSPPNTSHGATTPRKVASLLLSSMGFVMLRKEHTPLQSISE